MKNCSVLAFDSSNVDEVFDIRQGEGVYFLRDFHDMEWPLYRS